MESRPSHEDVTIEDCSDDEYSNCSYPRNNSTNNNNTSDDLNNNNSNNNSFYVKLGSGRPVNIQVTAKVLLGSVSAITALNAERKRKSPPSNRQ